MSIKEIELKDIIPGKAVSVTFPIEENGNYLVVSGMWVGHEYGVMPDREHDLHFSLKHCGRCQRNVVTGNMVSEMDYDDSLTFAVSEIDQGYTVFYLCEPAWWQAGTLAS